MRQFNVFFYLKVVWISWN